MAKASKDARQEAPSARRLQQAWRQGNVPLGHLAVAVAALACGLATVSWGAEGAIQKIVGLFQRSFELAFVPQSFGGDGAQVAAFGNEAASLGLWLWAPVVLAAFGAALLVTLGQTRGSLRALRGPQQGGARSVASVVLGGFVFACVSAGLLWSLRGELVRMASVAGAGALLAAAGEVTLWLLLRLLVAAGMWAVIDLVWQWARWRKGLRMSRRELQEEARDQSGDAQIRAARRRAGREL